VDNPRPVVAAVICEAHRRVHWQLAILALILLGYAAISGRVEGTSITAPIVFTALGMLFGSEALGLVEPAPGGVEVKLLAEATLTVVLFADASRIDLRALRGELAVPARLLGIGLPLTLLAGFVAAFALLGELAWPEALLLAVILAPTDAALGQEVVTLTRLPSRIRQGLNVESGLNDGICVPLFFIVLAVAQAEETSAGRGDGLQLVAEKIGYGLVGGVVAGVAAAVVVVGGVGRRLVDASWLQVVPLAGAALAFGLAEAIGGSGFIAAFVGGAVFGGLRRGTGGEVSYLVEEAGALLAAVTFVVFGAVLLAPAIGDVTLQVALYAVLSLTLVRMLPVAFAMLGTGARRRTVWFVGWFGPRGLASIVFALLLVEEGGLPNDELILTVTFVTVGLSVLAHGVSAAPFSRRYADWFEAHPRPGPRLEAQEGTDVRWRQRLADLDRG
jgi:NhaP-type Na+/H+ or K+/H+ antiporter